MANIPKDPVMLLSYLNTQLRDFYPDMDELCRALDLDRKTVDEAMASIDYAYDSAKNQYVLETSRKMNRRREKRQHRQTFTPENSACEKQQTICIVHL